MKKHKVVVIFPKYKLNDSSHFPYWYRVFEEAGKKLQLLLVFETGSSSPSFNNCDVYRQKIRIKPFNLLERLVIFCWLRLQGYQHFYVHYSIYSLFLAKVVTFLFGGKTYLWDCEYYEKKPTNRLLIIALKLADVVVTGHEKIAQQYKKILKMPHKDVRVVDNWVIEKGKKL